MKDIFKNKKSVLIYTEDINKKGAIELILNYGYDNGFIKDLRTTSYEIYKREELGSTGIGDGVAIPHAKLNDIEGVVVVFGYFTKGVDFESVDGEKVYFIFLILTEAKNTTLHLKTLSCISKLIKNTEFKDMVKNAKTTEEIHKILNSLWDKVV